MLAVRRRPANLSDCERDSTAALTNISSTVAAKQSKRPGSAAVAGICKLDGSEREPRNLRSAPLIYRWRVWGMYRGNNDDQLPFMTSDHALSYQEIHLNAWWSDHQRRSKEVKGRALSGPGISPIGRNHGDLKKVSETTMMRLEAWKREARPV
jgi:hypothetical protein